MGGSNLTEAQPHGRPAEPAGPSRPGGTTISTDSSGGADIGMSLTGMLGTVWGGIVGVTAFVSVFVEGSDWYHVLRMAYETGVLLTVTSCLFYYGTLGMLASPERRPINGPVQVDLVPDGDGLTTTSILYYKELLVVREGPE